MVNEETSIFTSRHVAVDGYSIDVRSNTRAGRKTLILLHGIGVSEKYFRPFADVLSSRYNVISLTLPGYGETKRPSRALNLDELARVVEQFILQENITRPVIIGQSMGCQIVARLGLMSTLKIDRLILLSPTVNNTERTAPLQFLRLMQDALREPLAVNLILVVDYLKFGFVRYMQTQRHMIADALETHLAKCKYPTLVIQGERDKIVPRKWAKLLEATLENGSLSQIKSGPHNFQFTHPEESAKLCVDFIER